MTDTVQLIEASDGLWLRARAVFKEFLVGINPIDVKGWPDKTIPGKIYEVSKVWLNTM